MKTVKAKKLVTTSNSFGWFGSRYNINLYRGCNFGCIYCDSRSDCYQVENFDEVKVKENVKEMIHTELKSKQKTGIITMGAMSDPYNSYEKTELATKTALEAINTYKFGLNITTKSDLILRDIEILKKINSHSEVIISLTITTLDDRLAKLIEPGSPPTSRRFEVLKELSDAGLYCGITFMPLIPYLNDDLENVLGVVKKAHEAGVKFIFAGFGVTQREGQMEYMYEKFDQHFPGLKQKFIKEFNYKYSCESRNSLYEPFKEACKKHDIVYKMDDIVSRAREFVKERQVSLF